jgi:hypothetical protein
MMNRRVNPRDGADARRTARVEGPPAATQASFDARELGEWIHRELAQHTTALAFQLQGLLDRARQPELVELAELLDSLACAVKLAERTADAVRTLSDHVSRGVGEHGEPLEFPAASARHR